MGLGGNHEQHEDEFFGGAGGGLQFMGVLNALRTGDPMLDMVIAMLFPAFIRFIFDSLSKLVESLKFDIKLSDYHERRIVHKSSKNAYGDLSSDEDSQNTVLIKAINLYLHNQLNLDLKEAYVDLTSTEDKNASVGRSRYNYDYDSDNDNGDDDSKTVVGALSKYKIVQKPPPNQWHDLGHHGGGKESAPVQLKIDKIEDERNDGNGRSNSTRTEITHSYHFKSPSGQAIDAVVQKAYSWYMDELRKLEDNARYFYELKSTDSSTSLGRGDCDEDGGGSSDSRICYKRYRLSDEKTFASLFFRQKESVLKLLNHFQAKTGKYQIQGYPHKLGFLLHGPPGSGKSSAIKALAQYTGRSIINVPLSRVTTNTELMSIFFDIRKYVEGESVPVKLGFKDVIFVMEDVDAASKVVRRRDGKKVSASLCCHSSSIAMKGECNGDDLPSPKSFFRLLLESDEADCKELVKMLLKRSTRLREEAAKPELMKSIAQRVTALPGLGVVGDAAQTKDNLALQRIGNDALRTAKQLEDDMSTIDRYLASQARILINMLEQQDGQNSQNRDEFSDNGSHEGHDEEEDDGPNDSPVKDLDDSFVDELLLSSPHEYSFSKVPFPLYENDNVTTVTSPLSANDSDDDDIPSMLNASSFSPLLDTKGSEKSSYKLSSSYGPSLWGKSSSLLKDELNLTGLLNVLDGVVDSPGRIVVMTTNHVDHLDPALIRPGRIDKKLLLGYMEPVDVLSMLEHYFQLTLSDDQRERVETAMMGGEMKKEQPKQASSMQLRRRLTPAQVEQLMAEHDEIEDMITALEQQGRVAGSSPLLLNG